MVTLTQENIQILLDQPRGRGMVVSCYANMTVTEGFEAHWLQPFKTEASQIRQRLAEDHQTRQEFERNLEAIQKALESPEARLAKGMAVLSAVERGFLLVLPSEVPFENRLVADEQPYVVPLLEAYLRQRGYLVVLTDTHKGRLYAADAGGARLLEELEEEVPKKTPSAGEPLGKEESIFARHRKEDVLHHFKEMAQRVERRWDESTYQGIILLGVGELLEQFRALLPDRLSRQVVHEAPRGWTGEHAEIDAVVRTVTEQAQAAEERRVLGEFTIRLQQARSVAAGPQEVITALRDGQVRELILAPDRGAVASRCTGCRALFTDKRPACPYCNAPCEARNLWQEILALAMGHGIWVHLVRPDAELDRHEGIAALLSRDDPQWAPPRKPAPKAETTG